MDFTNRYKTLTRCLVERGLFAAKPFTLIDVGCSGGIPDFWRALEPALQARGIDPQTVECQRLNDREKNPLIRHLPAFLGLPATHSFHQARGQREPWTGNPWQRLSGARAAAILGSRVPVEHKPIQLNEWHTTPLVEPARKLRLDELVAAEGLRDVDFIKIDIDGADLEVLHSAEQTIRNSPVLGLTLEVNFFGSADETDHTFHNTDRLMRRWGFELFDLTTRRHSSAALPAPFRCDESPFETTLGRIVQGDALYLRDPCGWPANPVAAIRLDALKLLKLACLFELFGMPDHAAELLRDQGPSVGALADPQPLLHLLANELDPHLESYDVYLAGFHADPTSFYPSRWSSRTADHTVS